MLGGKASDAIGRARGSRHAIEFAAEAHFAPVIGYLGNGTCAAADGPAPKIGGAHGGSRSDTKSASMASHLAARNVACRRLARPPNTTVAVLPPPPQTPSRASPSRRPWRRDHRRARPWFRRSSPPASWPSSPASACLTVFSRLLRFWLSFWPPLRSSSAPSFCAGADFFAFLIS